MIARQRNQTGTTIACVHDERAEKKAAEIDRCGEPGWPTADNQDVKLLSVAQNTILTIGSRFPTPPSAAASM